MMPDKQKTLSAWLTTVAAGSVMTRADGATSKEHQAAEGWDKVSEPTERFDDRGEIARGGMGSVRRVFDRSLRRDTAMKVLLPAVRESRRGISRFVKEAQITGQLEHPNIVPVHEVGCDHEGTRYFNMRLVQGATLESMLRDLGDRRLIHVELEKLLHVMLKVCDAVAFAHSRGVIHRDLKPENVMVGEFGEVYVMDWGIARVVGGSSQVLVDSSEETEDSPTGTPAYMAPEQAQVSAQDERTDVFLLGGMLYQILTGRAPYADALNYHEALGKALHAKVVSAQQVEGRAPKALCQIAMKALALDPSERFRDVHALREAIAAFLRGAFSLPTRRFAAGEMIVREGDPGASAFIIENGRARVFRGTDAKTGQTLREMGPGEVFGETAVFSEKPRSASVSALTDLDVVEVDRSLIEEGLALSSWLGVFVKALADRFREADQKLHELSGAAVADSDANAESD